MGIPPIFKQGLKGIEFGLVFVDDASTDGTASLIEAACKAARINLAAVSLKTRMGQHSCIRRGSGLAHGSCTCVMSADRQEPACRIPQILEEVLAGAELVIAIPERRRDNAVTDRFAKRLNLFLHCAADEAFPPVGYDFYTFHSSLKSRLDLGIRHFSYPRLDFLRCAQSGA